MTFDAASAIPGPGIHRSVPVYVFVAAVARVAASVLGWCADGGGLILRLLDGQRDAEAEEEEDE